MWRIYLLALGLTLTVGCQHDTDVFDGPSLNDRFGPFTVQEELSVNRTTVDFSAGEAVFFEALFSKNINWVVEITGQESGAVKLIEGFSRELTIDNARWNGTTTDLPLFRQEACEIKLIIPEEDSLTFTAQVEVTGSRVYDGSLITDFEEDLGTSLFTGNFEFELTDRTGIQSDIPAGQGSNYFLFEGTDGVVPNNFAGLIRIFPSANGETYFQLPTSVPESAYFNFMLYGDGAPNTIAVIQFFTDTNEDGQFSDGVDQSFEIGAFPVEHVGWKILSPTMDLTGMSQIQMEQIVGIQILLIHATQGGSELVRFGIDYLTFTQDQPFQP
ncbi:MAG: hypothetical protein AAF399_14630 [Bacteroidota bacterium]